MAVKFVLALLLTGVGAAYGQVEYQWKDNRIQAVRFNGLKPDSDRQPELRIAGSETAIAGSWHSTPVPVFIPAIPLKFNCDYLLTDTWGNILVRFRTPPSRNTDVPVITGIFPGSDTVPANILKIYVTFSQPMREFNNYQGIELVDATTGQKVDQPFLILEPELWNKGSDTLTLWFDPGRIKRDLIPNRQMGPVLAQGHRYRLVVGNGMKGINQQSVQALAEWEFTATTADRRSPDPDLWQIRKPEAGTREAVTVLFDENLDALTALEYINIMTENGSRMPVERFLLPEGKGIEFIPERDWLPARYTIVIDPEIEDFAGNRVYRLFDQHIDENNSEVTRSRIVLNFLIH